MCHELFLCLFTFVCFCNLNDRLIDWPTINPPDHSLFSGCLLLHWRGEHSVIVFTAQCTLLQSAVLRSHVVRLSVTLVICVHIGWKSWKLIAQTIGPKPSLLLANMQAIHLLTWGTWGNLGETRGGVGKNGMLEKGNISETHKDRGKNTRKGLYRNSPITLFWAVPSPTSYTHPFDP